MKYAYSAAFAALIAAVTAKDDRTFAVLRFTNKQLTKGRMDPIVSPGETSAHVHTVLGGSGFSIGATGEDLANSECSTAMIKGDNSAYWFPSLYFKDPKTGDLESVEVNYSNIYYLFEATNDEIKAFPLGLNIVAGEPHRRTPPTMGSKSNLDPSKGDVNAVRWTCPRQGNNYEPLSWPEDSDGTTAGIGDAINLGEGVGFPSVDCDGLHSPLRADIHFPSCYNPKAGLTNHKENMAYPKDAGDGMLDCPEGWMHVPHLFFEVYWSTGDFKDRWESNSGKQPFVLSNGDATGFGSHADFMAGWDEELLQHIIDTCDAGTAGMDNCPGLFYGLNEDDCTIPAVLGEKVDGTFTALPGNNPLSGWQYGEADAPPVPEEPETPEQPETPESPAATSAPAAPFSKLPTFEEPVTNVVEDPSKPEPTLVRDDDESPAEPTAAAESPAELIIAAEPAPEPTTVPEPVKPTTSCKPPKVATVWQTVTVTKDAYAEPTAGATLNTTGTVAGFQFAGCFMDSKDRVLSDSLANIGAVSNEKCVSHCKKAGFLLAGTEFGGECFCGNEIVGSKLLEEAECNIACAGDATDTCGGDWALSVYSESGEASLKSGNTRRHLHARHAHAHAHGHRRSL